MYTSNGVWNIKSMTYTLVNTDENGISVTISKTVENAGTFTFEKEGNGSYNFTLDGVSHSQSFAWSTSDESLSIAKIAQSVNIFTGDIEQFVIAFGGEKSAKNKVTLEGTETYQGTTDTGITQNVLTATIMLEKN